MRKLLLILNLISLLIGGVIYLLFRSCNLYMFKWFENTQIFKIICALRLKTIPLKSEIPEWIIFSAPDGLWVLSYECLILFIWGFEIKAQSLFWLFLIPVLAIVSELLQYVHAMPGTFDKNDVTMYILGFLLPLYIHVNTHEINKKLYEKKNYQ